MSPTRTTLTSLIALTACALTAGALIGCGGGSSFHASKTASDSPAADPGGYDQGGGDFDAPSSEGEAPAQPGYGHGAPPPARAPMTSSADRAEMAPKAHRRHRSDPFELARPDMRPGLATQWGERRHSRVTTAPFVRAERLSPFAMSKVYYNDPQGIAAMSDTLGGSRRHTRRFTVGAGHVEVGLRDGSGRFLTGFVANGSNYVTGIGGHRYTIVIKNHSPGRIEALVSVDGLDVIDGKSGSLSKRGYIVDPFGDLEIDGFRTSSSEVAAFRFGSVRNSYAAKKHGDTRNVGVIGVAVFHERGDSPRLWGTPRTHGDVTRRQSADPFPERYAAPPN